jgi:uncharacterized protein YjbI with pentapeptide repeats
MEVIMKKNFHVLSMAIMLSQVFLQADLCAMQDPDGDEQWCGTPQQRGHRRQRQEFSAGQRAAEAELDSEHEQEPPRIRRRQAQGPMQEAAASSSQGFGFESFSDYIEAAAIQATQPPSPQLEMFAKIMQAYNLSNPMEAGDLVHRCDQTNKTLLFERPCPELLPIKQLPSLYQAYPALALFSAYGNQCNALCGYYAAHNTKVFTSHPQATDQELIELLNNRRIFEHETLQPGKQTILALRERAAEISNLFGEEIELLIPRGAMNNIIIVGGARITNQGANEKSLAHRNELVRNFIEERINNIIWILSSGNHWITVLARRNQNREVQLIITDSMGIDRRRMTAIREIYQDLTGHQQQAAAPAPAAQQPPQAGVEQQPQQQQFPQRIHHAEEPVHFSIEDILRARSGDKNLVNANFQWADLRGIPDLTNVNLTGANLSGADLRGVNLSKAQLVGANLTGANLSGTNLTDANLRGATIVQTQFTGANFLRTTLTDATIDHADFSHSQITEASLRNLRIVNECNFEQAQLTNLIMMNVTINNANFSQAVFNVVDIIESEIDHVNMSRIKVHILFLNNTIIRNINFSEAEFKKGLVIQNTAIIGPNLDFTGATINESSIIGNTYDLKANRLEGITDDDYVESGKAVTGGILGGGMMAIDSGAITAATSLGVGLIFPPAGIAMAVGGSLGSLFISTCYGMAMHDIIAGPFANSIICRANFTGAKLNDVRVSSLKFVDCAGIDHRARALGCVFVNIFSSNPNDLENFKYVGARVNNQYTPNHAAFWERHDESYLADLVINLGGIGASAFGGEVGRGLAQGGLRALGIIEDRPANKDTAPQAQNPVSQPK